jgi:DNA-binding ferritin-like protein
MKTKSNRLLRRKTRKQKLNTSHRRTIITTFLQVLNCIKLYHWSTKSYSQHKATDELYYNLNKKVDDFVETMLGKTNDRISFINTDTCKVPNKSQFIKNIHQFKTFLIDLNDILNPIDDTNLINIRDEILQYLDKLIYLFQLK